MDTYQKVVLAAETALDELKKTEKNKPINGRDLQQWIENHQDRFSFTFDEIKSSWGAYLTKASADSNTRIAKEPGKYNYILQDKMGDGVSIEDEDEDVSKSDEEKKRNYAQREEKLYPLLADWFKSFDYQADVTATSKRGRTWGNPDVTSVTIVDNLLGGHTVEIRTIEAKISIKGWRKEFFEAVSHKRFSNRAYFAFAFPAENTTSATLDSIDEYREMKKYAEKFRVGILVVFMKEKAYEILTKESLLKDWELSLGEVTVRELWPALFDFVDASETNYFLSEVLGLKSHVSVRDFGKPPYHIVRNH